MIVVLVAGMLVVILGMAALAIDVGSFYQAQRQAQSAADAAALAASQDLPTNTNAAANDGTTYGLKNFPTSTVVVTPNYNNNSQPGAGQGDGSDADLLRAALRHDPRHRQRHRCGRR